MAFRNLKVTCTKVEGKCSRTREGAVFYLKNAKIELPPGQTLCLFALSSMLPALTGAMMKTAPGDGMLDILEEWQCPDPLAKVLFRSEAIAD